MLRLFCLAALCLSLVMGMGKMDEEKKDMDKAEEKEDKYPELGITEDLDPNSFWLSNTKEYEDDEIYKDHPCAGGTPAAKKGCKNDYNCPTGFSCVETLKEKEKVCCIQNEKLVPYMQCPENMTSSANKFCMSDDDCEENSHCHHDWDIPKDLEKELHKEHIHKKDEKDPREPAPVGMCCTEKREEAPEVLDNCPSGYLRGRHLPCGISLPGCELESHCMYPQDSYGRCCLSVDTAVKTGLKGYFRRWGYRGGFRGGFHGGIRRGFHGGYRPYWGRPSYWGRRWGPGRYYGRRYRYHGWY